MIQPHRVSQEALKYIYESAKARMGYNPEREAKAISIVNNHSHFDSEKDALEFAVEQMKKTNGWYQVWAKVEKDEDNIYRISNWWLSTDVPEVWESAEYIGMVQLYDSSRILSIIDDNLSIDDVVAYY